MFTCPQAIKMWDSRSSGTLSIPPAYVQHLNIDVSVNIVYILLLSVCIVVGFAISSWMSSDFLTSAGRGTCAGCHH